MNKKKVTASALAAFMIAGSTQFTAFAEMPSGTVVLGDKAFDLLYANDPANFAEISELAIKAENIYVKAPWGEWVNNTTQEVMTDASVIPAVVYKNAEGTKNYAEADGDEKDAVDASELKVASVSAISNTKIQVKLEDAVEAVDAGSFEVTEKNSDEELEVINATVEGKVVVVETEAMKAGAAYTLTANEVSKNFTAIKENKSAPAISKVECTDNNVVTVTFKAMVDEEIAEDINNYSISNDVEVISAKISSDRKSVELSTSDLGKRGRRYTLTVENVANIDGKAMTSKATKSFSSKSYTKVPKVTSVRLINTKNNEMLKVEFNSPDHSISKESAENLDNYLIDGLDILSAELSGKSEEDNVVYLTTEPQKVQNYYLEVSNISDTSVSENTMTKTQKIRFRGGQSDKSAPSVLTKSNDRPVSISNTKIQIKFSEHNKLDLSTITDVDNYSFNKDLIVEDATIEEDDNTNAKDNNVKTVILTTSPQKKGETYKYTIKGIADEYGNTMKRSATGYVRGLEYDEVPPYVKGIKAKDLKTIEITFKECKLEAASAKDPTNYEIYDGDDRIGTALKTKIVDEDPVNQEAIVEVTFETLKANTNYTVKMNGIADITGNELSDVKADVTTPADSSDVTAPEILYTEARSNKEVIVHFDEPVEIDSIADVEFKVCPKGKSNIYTTLRAKVLYDDTNLLLVPDEKLEDANYTIEKTKGRITDSNRNLFENPSDGIELVGYKNDPELVTYDIYDQIDAKTFKVTFTDPVKVPTSMANINSKFKVEKPTGNSYDSYCSLLFKKTVGNLDIDENYKFNFNYVKTFTGKSVVESKDVKLDTLYEDNEAPSITGVRAVSENKVKVDFSEPLGYAGSYKITYTDDEGKEHPVTYRLNSSDMEDDGILYLEVTRPLVYNGEYNLTINSVPKDLAGNKLEDAKYVDELFMGVSIKEEGYVSGAQIINDSRFAVNSTFDKIDIKEVSGEKVITSDFGDGEVKIVVEKDPKKSEFTTAIPLLNGEDYTADLTEDGDVTFTGMVDNNLGFYVQNNGEVDPYVTFQDFGYPVELNDADGSTEKYGYENYDLYYVKLVKNDEIAKEDLKKLTLHADGDVDGKLKTKGTDKEKNKEYLGFTLEEGSYYIFAYEEGTENPTEVNPYAGYKMKIERTKTETEKLTDAKTALDLEGKDNVTSDLELPETEGDASITWKSSDTKVITDAGKVTRPAAGEEDAKVKLTATLTVGEKSDTKEFQVTVKAAEKSDEDKVADAKKALDLGDLSNVIADLTLPETQGDASITWKSSDTKVITNEGKVTRPTDKNVEVTLTATLTVGEESDTKDFTVTVIKAEDETDAKTAKSVLEKLTDLTARVPFSKDRATTVTNVEKSIEMQFNNVFLTDATVAVTWSNAPATITGAVPAADYDFAVAITGNDGTTENITALSVNVVILETDAKTAKSVLEKASLKAEQVAFNTDKDTTVTAVEAAVKTQLDALLTNATVVVTWSNAPATITGAVPAADYDFAVVITGNDGTIENIAALPVNVEVSKFEA
jgi:aBig family protein